MKYLMQILLGLILLQLLQSCDYSKSRDVLWMKKNFENNAELFFDVTNLFNNSIPINLKKENYVNFNINDKNNRKQVSSKGYLEYKLVKEFVKEVVKSYEYND